VQAQRAIRRLCEGDPDTVRALSSITRQIDKLVKLVHDLLDITRFEDGRMSLERREFDVSALLEEQRERMQAFCGDAYQLRVRAPAQLQVVADRNRIDQVLTNLISNAVRYSPNGGSIEIAAEAVDGLLYLTVRDHGIGIPPSKQSFIFERFARAHGSAYGGLGLGLTIARSIVELHGGKMWVQSSGVTGEGSTFHAQIPLLAPESSLLVHAPDREAMM
jgi:signal transduction histidine kinase